MIIGISGKKKSGKDTVAKILQYFTLPYALQTISIDEWVNEISYGPEIQNLSTFLENRKYSDKLKDFVSILLNIPRWKLELPETKEMILPPHWDRWVLETEFDKTIHATNSDAKAVINYLRLSKSEYRLYKEPLSIRLLMQLIGTEACRDIIHPDIWVNALFADYTAYHEDTYVDKETGLSHKLPVYPNWVVTDVRFPNELNAVKYDLPGRNVDIKRDFRFVVRIERPELQEEQELDTHLSETALDDYEEWDYVIENNRDLPELAFKVHEMLSSHEKFQKYFFI